MGQTLTHGIYLPDEGERNCYDGLAGNWQLLDGAVGTIAEHTSALAGKAPLVHTHTKADITDLLNSDFIPSANNSYDLGSSSNQWNNLYAKNYYYNGTQWGLDKDNTWTGDNTYTKCQNAVINGSEIGVVPTETAKNGILFKDKDGNNIGWLRHQYDTSGDISIEMLVSNKYKNGALDPTGTQIYQGVKQVISSTGTSYFNWSGYVNNSLYPYTTETFNIGDSTHQWNNLYAKQVNTQSVNGINPGALSLPNLDSTQYDPIDFSQWNVSLGWGNNYTPQSDGWLHVNIKDSTDCSVFVFASNSNPMYAASAYGNGSQGLTGRVALMMPVRAGVTYTFMVKASSTSDIYSVIFIPALGNV